MGTTVSVCNLSMVVLNVAFSQVGPLYYENQLKPGCCMTRNVGKVWFSIVAYVDTGNNRYDVGTAIGRHFTNTVPHALNAVSTGLKVTGFGPFAQILDVLMLGVSEATDVYKQWDNSAIHSKGWYFGSDRTIYIKGGPHVHCKTDQFRWISVSSAQAFGGNYHLEDAHLGYAKGYHDSCPFEGFDDSIPTCNMSEPIGHNLEKYCHTHGDSEVCISGVNSGVSDANSTVPDANGTAPGSNVTHPVYDVTLLSDKLKDAWSQVNASTNLLYDDIVF